MNATMEAKTVLASKTICGTTVFGKHVRYTVEAIHNPESRDLQGRWTVAINGKVCRWYAMERPAVRCVERARVGAYGISFGEAF